MDTGAKADTVTGADARAMAMRYLGRRDYSCLELTRKLMLRGVGASTAEQVVADLAEFDAVSDERYAEVFARQRAESLHGPVRIRAELKSKGVNEQLIAKALLPFEHDWYECALRWASKKLRGELDQKTRARIYRGGTYRGFTHDQVMRAMDRLSEA